MISFGNRFCLHSSVSCFGYRAVCFRGQGNVVSDIEKRILSVRGCWNG